MLFKDALGHEALSTLRADMLPLTVHSGQVVREGTTEVLAQLPLTTDVAHVGPCIRRCTERLVGLPKALPQLLQVPGSGPR